MFLIWYLNTQVPTDLAFLDVSKYDIDLRISFLNSFLDVFGSDKVYKNYAEVIKAKEILAKAMQEKWFWICPFFFFISMYQGYMYDVCTLPFKNII